MIRAEIERKPPGVRAREQPDEHVDRDGRQPDQLAKATEHIGDEEECAQDCELFSHGHDQPPGGVLAAVVVDGFVVPGTFAARVRSPVR